jgi:hypothetical protein
MKSHWGHEVSTAKWCVEQVYLRVCAWKKLEPEKKFWQEENWKKFYRLQIILANELIKLYSESSVINGIKQYKPFTLRDIKLDKAIENFYKDEIRSKPVEVKTFSTKKEISLRDKLKNL